MNKIINEGRIDTTQEFLKVLVKVYKAMNRELLSQLIPSSLCNKGQKVNLSALSLSNLLTKMRCFSFFSQLKRDYLDGCNHYAFTGVAISPQ